MTNTSVYIGNSVAHLDQVKSWLGDINTIQLHGGTANWSDWLTSVDWMAGMFKNQGVDIMWSIPLIPYGANLGDAAKGSYNGNYLAMAKQLLADSPNQDQIYVRLGWEFNGKGWNSSSAVGQPDNYVAAYREFVDACRSVSDKFVFEWTPNLGKTDMDPTLAYPGDDYVDVIGIDFYYDVNIRSTNVEKVFDWMKKTYFGLQWQQDFAAAHGKPTAIAEWGLNFDSPEFVQLVAKWAADHNMLYQNYWDSNAAFNGELSDGQFPEAAAAFRSLFGASLDPVNGTSDDNVLLGTARNDVFRGGDGDDVYHVNNAGDRVVEWYNGGKGGIDRVVSTVDYTLDANVENLTLVGSANLVGHGNAQANTIIGNSGDNKLYGEAGNDRLYGGDGKDLLDGGTGADVMQGGDGDDIYYVDNAGDTVVEWYHNGLGGNDVVNSSISYTLGDNVERLTLTGNAVLTGTGNAQANMLVANNAGSTLYGLDGNDQLVGGNGADRLFGGNGDDMIRGGAGKDVLDGGAGKDVLDGGAGVDTMQGGDGNDTYYVDNAGDIVIEWANGGKGGLDTVFASVSYTLTANVENLTLTGAGSLSATGNGCDNEIHGNAGNNVINGGGGDDVLYGGGGVDKFVFGLWSGKDVIQDFDQGDKIDLSGWYAAGKTATVTSAGGDTFITFDADNVIELHGVDMSHLQKIATGYAWH